MNKVLYYYHMKNSFSRIGAKIWNCIPDSNRALPKHKFKNTLQSRLLDILILQDHVGVRTLIGVLFFYLFKCSQNIAKKSLNDADSLIFQFNFTHTLFHLPILKHMYSPSS